ncbi:MAG: hypothetical protein KAT83_02005, partial [Candidatus Aenigmarchaeota archaeon]|nr:hypothetical protein [Candidatus Aenigmarchaeota archaeon]
MKGTSNLVHIIILLVITFFVAAGSIMVVRSAAENADEPTTGTLTALRNPSLGERLYCKIYCPDPVNDCEIPDAKKEMCTAIAESPADFTYSGTVPGPSGVSAIVDGSFIPGGTLTITFSEEAEADYGSID